MLANTVSVLCWLEDCHSLCQVDLASKIDNFKRLQAPGFEVDVMYRVIQETVFYNLPLNDLTNQTNGITQ